MLRVGSALLFLLMVTSAWAQSTIPGTFNTQSIQPTAVIAGPIMTPPIVSFGSGLSAPTVINGQTAVVAGAPAGIVSAPLMSGGYVNGYNGYVPMPTPAVLPTGYAISQPPAGTPAAPARFDFIVARSTGNLGETEVTAGSVGDTSLGQVAASLRKGPPPTQRKFNNDDIARISGTSKMPGASTQDPTYPQQQAQPQQQPHSSIGSTPTGAKPSPFAPRPVPQSQTPTTTASEPN